MRTGFSAQFALRGLEMLILGQPRFACYLVRKYAATA